MPRQEPSGEPAALLAGRDRDHQDFRLVLDHARDREGADCARSAVASRNVTNHVPVREQPLEFVFAPAVLKCARMNEGERGGVTRTRIENRRIGPPEQRADRSHHWRGSR
jgi:hypothetical protein